MRIGDEMIDLSQPDITDREREAVLKVLNSKTLSMGQSVNIFENKVSEYIGVKHAIAMSSGTAALHSIIRSLNISEGDYVLTTPFSFISTANCILFENAEPIFVDIDPFTFNLRPEDCEKTYLGLPGSIRKKVKAIIYVDVFGAPADNSGFDELGRKYGLRIIEDSAEAIGSESKGKKCGSFGDAGLFAFYPNKQITTGEGGMVVTNDDQIAKSIKSLRNQGREEQSGWLQHTQLGYNYRISDINCAIGIVQMDRIEEIKIRRKKVMETYNELFFDIFDQGLLSPQHILEGTIVNPFVYVLKLNNTFKKSEREDLLNHLSNNGVQCSNYFTPIHLQSHFQKLGWGQGDMPVTEQVSERTIALPFYNLLKEDQIKHILNITESFFINRKKFNF